MFNDICTVNHLDHGLCDDLNNRYAIITGSDNYGDDFNSYYYKMNLQMFDLDEAISIIDTPGIKGFGVVDMDKEEISDYFPEFFKLKQDCKFNKCLHVDEPKCAVKEALEKDEKKSSGIPASSSNTRQ